MNWLLSKSKNVYFVSERLIDRSFIFFLINQCTGHRNSYLIHERQHLLPPKSLDVHFGMNSKRNHVLVEFCCLKVISKRKSGKIYDFVLFFFSNRNLPWIATARQPFRHTARVISSTRRFVSTKMIVFVSGSLDISLNSVISFYFLGYLQLRIWK